MAFEDSFAENLASTWPPEQWRDVTVLLAVSGGLDSVALLRGMLSIRPAGPGRLVVAHFNHRLRSQDSDADQAFVQQLCQSLDVACEHGQAADSLRSRDTRGLEAAAREARYTFLRSTAERLGARYVATAHTADDQIETVLQRILREAGIAGLAGIPHARPLSEAVTVVRPLLGFGREELAEYLRRLKQPYRVDPSNSDPQFTRNRIRHQLLPLLESDYHRGVRAALLRLGELAAGAQQVVDQQVETQLRRCVDMRHDGSVRINCRELAGQPCYLVCELLAAVWRDRGWPLREMGSAQWEELAAMAQAAAARAGDAAPPSRRMFPGAVNARCENHELWLSR